MEIKVLTKITLQDTTATIKFIKDIQRFEKSLF